MHWDNGKTLAAGGQGSSTLEDDCRANLAGDLMSQGQLVACWSVEDLATVDSSAGAAVVDDGAAAAVTAPALSNIRGFMQYLV